MRDVRGDRGPDFPLFGVGDGPPLYKYTSSLVPPLFGPKLRYGTPISVGNGRITIVKILYVWTLKAVMGS